MRSALIAPGMSGWQQLINHGDASCFLQLTGLDRPTFLLLEQSLLHLEVMVDDPAMRGRPSSLDFRAQIGLYLFYIGSTCTYKHLCSIFGITPSVCSRFIIKMKTFFTEGLSNHPDARIRYPNIAEKQQYAALVQRREPTVQNFIGFLDGVTFTVQCGEDSNAQAADFNGYNHDTKCNNIFGFLPTGRIAK